MQTLLIAAVLFLVVTLLLAARPASAALVRVAARRLPPPLGPRLHEEWTAELDAVSTRPGKLAFAAALAVTRRQAYAALYEGGAMPEFHDRRGGLATLFGGWKTMLIAPTLAGAALGYYAAPKVPYRYTSKSVIAVVPQQIPPEYVSTPAPAASEDRIRAIQQQLMSRRSLERVILDFNLYSKERRTGIMEDVVEQMRRAIEIELNDAATEDRSRTFTVQFTSADPRTAMRVTERVTSMMIDQSLRDREVVAEGTVQFLESQLEAFRRRLIDAGESLDQERSARAKSVRAIEYEMLEASFRVLLTKHHEAGIVANMEQRQIGESFKIVDAARLPSRPSSGPNSLPFTMVGAFAGGSLGGMALAGLFGRKRKVEATNPV